jgi:hypothetical protein
MAAFAQCSRGTEEAGACALRVSEGPQALMGYALLRAHVALSCERAQRRTCSRSAGRSADGEESADKAGSSSSRSWVRH